MSSLFTSKPPAAIQIGSMDLKELREFEKNLMDEKEIERCPEAAFLNNDKHQIRKLITYSVKDIVRMKFKK